MSEFDININNVKKEVQDLETVTKHLKQNIGEIQKVKRQMAGLKGCGQIASAMESLIEQLEREKTESKDIANALEQIVKEYEKAEKKITDGKDTTHFLVKLAKLLNDFLEKLGYNGAGVSEEKGGKFDGDPVNMCTGNYVSKDTIFYIKGILPIKLERYYNALQQEASVLGRGWSHCYEDVIVKEGNSLWVKSGDGRQEKYIPSEDGFYVSQFGSDNYVVKNGDSYVLTTIANEKSIFSLDGILMKKEDSNGNYLSFLYDEKQLLKVENGEGQYLLFNYNDDGLLESVSDCTSRQCKFSYNGEYLSQFIDAEGAATSYEYTVNGLLERIISPEDICILYNIYDENGRVIKQIFPDESEMLYEYFDDERKVTFTERNGRVVSYMHDEKMRHTRTIYEDGSYDTITYTDKNKRASYTNRLGNCIGYQYDNRGNVTKVIDTYGNAAAITYDSMNRPVCSKQVDGSSIKNKYDKKGNLIERIDQEGNITRLSYNEKGQIITVTSADESQINISYDERGNIKKITDARGAQALYLYDELNRVIETVDGNGNHTRYGYNEKDNLISVVNAEGNTRHYTYNYTGRVTKFIDFDNSEINHEYNAINKIEKTIDKLGNSTFYRYDKMWNVSEETDSLGYKKTYIYNKENLLEEIINEEGYSVKYEYDVLGNKTAVIDETGERTELIYDELNRISSICYPDGIKIEFTYNERGNVVKRQSSVGIFENMTYDRCGHLLSRTDQNGRRKTYTYNKLGRVAAFTDEAGRVTRYTYYKGGLLKRIDFADGTWKYFEYDGCKNIIYKEQSDGYAVKYVYDCMNRVVEVSSNTGQKKTYAYDAVGNMITLTDANGSITRFEYNYNGKVTKVINSLGQTNIYDYDKKGFLTSVMRLNGEMDTSAHEEMIEGLTFIKYKRDGLGNIIEEANAIDQVAYFEYDAKSRLVKKIDRDGFVTLFNYNKIDKKESVLYGDGQKVEFDYDELRRLSCVRDRLGEIQIARDLDGHITSIKDYQNNEVVYQYGKNGERKKIVYPGGREINYEYDELMRLSKLTDTDTEYTYFYNENGLLSKRSSGIIESEYGYNAGGMLDSLTHRVQDDILESYQYEYDFMGNRTREKRYRKNQEEETGIFEYQYDKASRLIKVQKDKKVLHSYEYDFLGNRKKMVSGLEETVYYYNVLNQLVKEEAPECTRHYQYDNRGNMVSVFENEQQIKEFTYNAADQLVCFRNDKGDKAEYQYDGLGNRVSVIQSFADSSAYNASRENSHFILDLTKSYNNVLMKEEDGGRQEFIWDSQLLSMVSGESVYQYLGDVLGSTTQILDKEGKSKIAYSYDEFGNDLSDNQGIFQPFGYTGFQKDSLSGNYFAKYRQYNAAHGRFVSEDLVKYGQNWFIYCSDNPFKYIDPLGLSDTGLIPDWLEDIGEYIRYEKCGDMIDDFTTATQNGELDTFLEFFDFDRGSNGVYHTNPDCWQWPGGYNDLYDAVFDTATSMDRNKLTATTKDGTEYVIWMWKGDYINLGAGAETGLYKGGEPHWFSVGKDERVPMDLALYYNGELVYTYNPTEPQWWITGFYPELQGVDADDLTVKGSIDLSDHPEIFDAFHDKYQNDPNSSLCFNSSEKTIYYEW